MNDDTVDALTYFMTVPTAEALHKALSRKPQTLAEIVAKFQQQLHEFEKMENRIRSDMTHIWIDEAASISPAVIKKMTDARKHRGLFHPPRGVWGRNGNVLYVDFGEKP